MNEFDVLHPSLQYHIVNTLGWPSLRPTQREAIAPIHQGAHCLLLAPTAGGKTEAAVIPLLSRMLKENWAATSVLYVCPIKALLNNLEPRLSRYAGLVGRRVMVWHGDVSQASKSRALKEAPDILLTTPESLESMLISARIHRESWFAKLRAVIVDELHAFAGDDRGWHLRSVLHRVDQYVSSPLQRIGLSATVSNPDELLEWFAPVGTSRVVGSAHVSTDAEVTIDHVASLQNAATVLARLHRGEKRLVYCDSRSSAEQLSSLLRAHDIRTFISHASLSVSERRRAEAAFSEEKDCVIVATSTLELGIDVGDLDRVIQIDAPSTVSSFLQRMGRTGRREGTRRNCLFLATNDQAFLLALGLAQKWSESWVEAACPPAEPWPIVAQQALVLSLERGELATSDLVRLLVGSFPELASQDLSHVVRHLIGSGFLDESAGVVRVGPQTEQCYGRSHYRDLLASFSGSMLLTARHGAAEVGYVDPTVVSGDGREQRLLLAGRSWRVTEVEWPRKIVWLEPVPDGGRARWIGSPRSLGREICQGIRTVLAEGAPPNVRLSLRAQAELRSLTDAIPVTPHAAFTVEYDDRKPVRTWTFGGTRANRTLARVASAVVGEKIRFDALSVQSPVVDLAGKLPETIVLTEPEIADFGASIKFSDAVPQDLLERTIVARIFELSPTPIGIRRRSSS